MAHPIIQVETLATFEDWKPVLNGHTVYVQDRDVKVSGMAHGDELVITTLENALKQGANCERFYFSFEPRGDHTLFTMLAAIDYSLADLLDVIAATSFDHGKPNLFGATVSRTAYRGIRVFSPFRLDRLRPLESEPKKWTVKHALRAIANGQYDELKCTGRYSDDYAYDADVNYHQGKIANALPFIKRIVESPSGWRVYDKDSQGKIGLCCHHFDNNEIKVNLEASHAAA